MKFKQTIVICKRLQPLVEKRIDFLIRFVFLIMFVRIDKIPFVQIKNAHKYVRTAIYFFMFLFI